MANLQPLLAAINAEDDPGLALDEVTRAALEMTGSRNSMIARLSFENDSMELKHGVGREWTREREDLQINVSTREGIVAFVAATGHSYLTGDVGGEERYVNLFEGTKSEMAVPIHDRFGRIRGVFNVESDRVDAYSDDSLATLSTLAEVASFVINREDLQIRESALIEVGHALDRAMSEEDVVKGVLRIGHEVLRFQAFSVFVYDRTRDAYVLRGSIGYMQEQVGKVSYRAGDGITGSVAKSLEPVLTHAPLNDPRWRGQNTEFEGEAIASFLAVPVVFRGRCVAILRALRRRPENKYLDNRFDPSDVALLQAIADHMAAAIDGIRNTGRLLHSERMAAWGELSAKSSHMIGNRVFALRGDVNEFGYLLGQPELARAALDELHRGMEVNLVRIEELLQDFRDFLTATNIEKAPNDLNGLVRQTASEIFPRRSAVALDFTLDESLPAVPLDDRRLRRAVSELVENAVGYVTEGSLAISTCVASRELVHRARLDPSKQYACVRVEDTGPGIADERKEEIFQPFFTGRVKGMGLGLSIVRGIAEAHGGSALEVGTQDKGASFVILLPLD